jgi:hypothetical protein
MQAAAGHAVMAVAGLVDRPGILKMQCEKSDELSFDMHFLAKASARSKINLIETAPVGCVGADWQARSKTRA